MTETRADFHRRKGRVSRIPECCIRWFVWFSEIPQRRRFSRLYRALIPVDTQFVPCPRHLLLESLGLSRISDNFHQWHWGDGTAEVICLKCGEACPGERGCR